MRAPDWLIGILFALAGAAVFAATLGFPRLEDGAPGPALFPRVLAVLMVGFGATLAVGALRARRQGAPPAASAAAPVARAGLINALLVFAAIVAFMVVAPRLGFLLTAAGILFALMWRLGTSLPRAALASAGLTLFVYLIFGKLLRVPLPLGLLWF